MMSNKINRVAIFSDIHANLQALEVVVDAIKKEKVAKYYCCGDIVGYGGNPNECVEMIRAMECPVVAGNHDHAALGLTSIEYFNDVAKQAVLWTQAALTPENAEYLKSLPLVYSDGPFFFVHASPYNPEEWNYILTIGEAKLSFQYFPQDFCFIGHSHQPFLVENNEGQIACPGSPEINIKNNSRYLINVGSVGQPRDTDPRACYAICDLKKKSVEIKRIEYDVEAAQKSLIDQGLPRELAERLAYGW